MPIYAYRCDSCGLAKDVLQKVSDPLLTVCPACGAETFKKQVTAAGFQLKGTGWYVTDFRGGDSKPAAKPVEKSTDGAKPDAAGKGDAAKPAAAAASESTSSDSTPAAPAASPAPPATGASGAK